ncbi:hypothetical protein [Streptomyces stelliscabiei]|uniref:Uncharacterized protein n=1 Tax=Streptomyces stelliscabiei TaxID=146820 RepID=A0A8I0TTM0_9ACTN|nr:hypothetical protein [Streptomyces stelliscabiei]MBE1599884.1 hypothetical protein [Streptomyces stelliscabiei]
MPDVTRPPYVPGDTLTPQRDITHQHFRPGDRVVVLKGVSGDRLWGDEFKVVTPSWHTPTDEDGWRLYDPHGGQRSFVTAHPRYLVHLGRTCPDCMIYQRALGDFLLPQFGGQRQITDCGWYTFTRLNQLMHINDARGGR